MNFKIKRIPDHCLESIKYSHIEKTLANRKCFNINCDCDISKGSKIKIYSISYNDLKFNTKRSRYLHFCDSCSKIFEEKYKNIYNTIPSKISYRIKTIEEFIELYGSDWQGKVSWVNEMNFLFGRQLTKKEYEKAKTSNICLGLDIYNEATMITWYISYEMVTEDRIYKPIITAVQKTQEDKEFIKVTLDPKLFKRKYIQLAYDEEVVINV